MIHLTKLDKFFENELNSDIKDILITCDKQGKYSLFGKYTIIPSLDGGFKTFTPKHAEEHVFSTLINAVSWCTLHNSGNFNNARRVVSLDLRLGSINIDIANHTRLFKVAPTPSVKLTYMIKVEEATLKKNLMLEEMSIHINKSKVIQERRFLNTRHQ